MNGTTPESRETERQQAATAISYPPNANGEEIDRNAMEDSGSTYGAVNEQGQVFRIGRQEARMQQAADIRRAETRVIATVGVAALFVAPAILASVGAATADEAMVARYIVSAAISMWTSNGQRTAMIWVL